MRPGPAGGGASRVVVVGGGGIGAAIAWRLARAAAHPADPPDVPPRSVVLVDDAPGQGSSYAAAGMLAPVTEASYGEEALLGLSRASAARYPTFLAELERDSGGKAVTLRTAGTLVVGFDADDLRVLDELHRFQRELGLDAERLLPRECRRLEPALSPRVRGGVRVRDDHSVDARELSDALLRAARAAGARLVPSRVAELLLEGGRVAGVRLGDGSTLPADTVVLAAGAASRDLPGLPPETVPPVRPVKGQILRLRERAPRPGEPLLGGTVRALVRGRDVYLVPYGEGRVVLGATVEEQGFDPAVTAGAVFELLRDAIDVVPGLAELELVETLARHRPGSPDNAPLLGPTALPGLVLATGHHRNGVLLTPVTADAITALLDTGELPPVAAPFLPARFPAADGATPASSPGARR